MNKRYAHATRAMIASIIARRNAGDITTLDAAEQMRMNGVTMNITMRVLTNAR